jgi:hypothetical protein
MAAPTIPNRLHVLAKPTGSTCNLNCAYCFYMKKEALYPGSRFRMSDEVLEAYLSQLIADHRTDTVTVAWQGGEPTLMAQAEGRAEAGPEKIGRNAPCPCGSGLKYKKCHGRPDSSTFVPQPNGKERLCR